MKLQTQFNTLAFIIECINAGYEELARIYTIKLVRSLR
jgi:hypothetical protein